MKVYVASSWRNQLQPIVVERLRREGHLVYDFRNPSPGDHGFHWSAIDPKWRDWSPEQFRRALQHEMAGHGFANDMGALSEADSTVLVLPCGRSAHLELGWAAGDGQRTFILALEQTEPELMYLMCDGICTSVDELVVALKRAEDELPSWLD